MMPRADGPLKILHLCAYPLFSGAVPSTLGLAAAQRRDGHTVFLALDTKRGAFNDFEEAAEPQVALHGLAPTPALTLSTKSTPIEVVRDLSRLKHLVRSEQIDVVHTHLSHDHVLATFALWREPDLIRVRTFHSARSLAPRFGQSWLNRQARGFIVRAQRHRELLCQRFGVPTDSTRVIAGGIDATRFAPVSAPERRAARRALDIGDDVVVIGHVALLADRGQQELVAALELVAHTNVQLLFVGRGEGEDHLRARVSVSRVGNRVHFAGYVPAKELRGIYAAMDAAFVPQAGNDASARAALEALACQIPIVAVRVDALADWVTPVLGYPLETREPAEIARGIMSLASDRTERERRGAAGHAYVLSQRSFEQEAAQTVAFYRTLSH